MRLYDIYQKAIDREITGVIKVGQDDAVFKALGVD